MSNLQALAMKHFRRHPGMFGVVFRMCAYPVGMFACMLIAAQFGGDTYMANLSLFILFSGAFELIWDNAHYATRGFRYIGYVACIIAMFVFGLVLVKQGSAVQAHCRAVSSQQ